MPNTRQCNICRGRKSKCDGGRPRCKLCSELNAECIYQEPGIKLDAGDKMILERLDRIEGILQMNWNGAANMAGPAMTHPTSRNPTLIGSEGMSDDRLGPGQPNNFTARTAVMYETPRHEEPGILMRPVVAWPRIHDLISVPFDSRVLLELELEQENLDPKASLSIDFSSNTTYIRAFFDNVVVWNASVNPYDWSGFYLQASRSDFREGAESCFVLFVLALGAANYEGAVAHASPEIEPPGMPYFSAAWGLLPTVLASHHILSSQCTILACNYLLYLVRPFEAWTLLSGAIPKLQVILAKPGSIPPELKELWNRIYWNAILLESSLASLDVPASNLPKTFPSAVDLLPVRFEPDLHGSSHEARGDHPWFLVALVTLHQLNEQIAAQTAHVDATQGPIASTLNTRLTEWYSERAFPHMPALPPPRGSLNEHTMEYLRTQYWLSRMRIYKPYICSVLTDESMTLAPLSICRDSCRACLDSAMRVLEDLHLFVNNNPWHKWQSALAAVDAVLIIMGASQSLNLSLLLPQADHYNNILENSIQIFENLATSSPSLARIAEVLRVAEEKRRDLVAKA